MGNGVQIERDWIPISNDNLVDIPTDHPVLCMEHKITKEHAYYDVKCGRFLTQQEAFDVLRGVSGHPL